MLPAYLTSFLGTQVLVMYSATFLMWQQQMQVKGLCINPNADIAVIGCSGIAQWTEQFD